MFAFKGPLSTPQYLGIDRVGFPVQDLAELFVEALPKRTAYYAFLEVCCDKDSALKRACSTSGLGIWEFHQTWSCLGSTKSSGFVEQQKTEGLLVHVHVSTPCSSGSLFGISMQELVRLRHER